MRYNLQIGDKLTNDQGLPLSNVEIRGVGFLARTDDSGELIAYVVTAGGGGAGNGNPQDNISRSSGGGGGGGGLECWRGNGVTYPPEGVLG